MKKILILLSFAFCVILLLSSCKEDLGSETETETKNSIPETEVNTETEAETEIMFIQTDEETFDIETPYCTLKYPVKWKDLVNVETIEANGNYEVKFTAILDWQQIPLFSIVFGNVPGAYQLGTIEKDAATVQVFLLDYSANSTVQLSDESYLTYRQMGEDINVVISKLVYDCGMILT